MMHRERQRLKETDLLNDEEPETEVCRPSWCA